MALAERTWQHPISNKPTRFGFSTIERWYYRALKEKRDPLGVLRRKLRADAGRQPAMSGAVRQAIIAQYAAHKGWSVRLHHDNLVALAESNPDLGPVPSYATLRRFLKANGFNKRRSLTSGRTEGAERAEARFLDREVRSYEAEHVGGLLHFDAHHGSRTVLTPRGEWVTRSSAGSRHSVGSWTRQMRGRDRSVLIAPCRTRMPSCSRLSMTSLRWR